MNSVGLSDSHASFRRKLSKREKKQLKKQEKHSRLRNENGDAKDQKDGVAEKLYTGNVFLSLKDKFVPFVFCHFFFKNKLLILL